MNRTWKGIWGIIAIVVLVMVVRELYAASSERKADLAPLCGRTPVSEERVRELTDRTTHVFGFVHEGSVRGEFFFDEAKFLTREEGACGRADGSVSCNPNGFAIQNDDTVVRAINIVSDTTIVGIYSCSDIVAIEISADELSEKVFMYTKNDLGGLPVWISESDGVVVEIAEQYLP